MPTETDTIAAKDVKPGMLIYNSHGNRHNRWVPVKEVKISQTTVLIVTSLYETVRHPLEGVAVRYSQNQI